jgi:hypothetical protein
VQEFVAHLSTDGLKELYQIANKLDFLDGAVWLGSRVLHQRRKRAIEEFTANEDFWRKCQSHAAGGRHVASAFR